METHDVYQADAPIVPFTLEEDCVALFRDRRFADGIARARRDEGWETNPVARLYVGIGRHYEGDYAAARAEYQVAADLSPRPEMKALCASNEGVTWLEQNDLDRALACYDRALEIFPTREFALLGRISVACERRDASAVRDAARLLRERIPHWRTSPVIVEGLLKDRTFMFLRDATKLFEESFDVSLRTLRLERVLSAP